MKIKLSTLELQDKQTQEAFLAELRKLGVKV